MLENAIHEIICHSIATHIEWNYKEFIPNDGMTCQVI